MRIVYIAGRAPVSVHRAQSRSHGGSRGISSAFKVGSWNGDACRVLTVPCLLVLGVLWLNSPTVPSYIIIIIIIIIISIIAIGTTDSSSIISLSYQPRCVRFREHLARKLHDKDLVRRMRKSRLWVITKGWLSPQSDSQNRSPGSRSRSTIWQTTFRVVRAEERRERERERERATGSTTWSDRQTMTGYWRLTTGKSKWIRGWL